MSRGQITSVIPCRRHHGEPFARVEVRINQRDSFFMFVDTARITTAISLRVQDMLGLPVSRRRLRVRDSQILGVDRAVLDRFALAGFPETGVGPLTVYVADVLFVDGRIGMNYLGQFNRICYDFAAETLLFTR